jgi:hypothetical protein
MSNPDSTGANIGGIITLAGFIAMIVVLIFSICDQDNIFFDFLLYGGLPMLIYVLMFIVIYISKPNTDVKNAVLSAIPTVGTTYLALFISYISYFRIPIASVFAPLFLGSANIIPQSTMYAPQSLVPLQQMYIRRGGHKKKKQAGGECCSPIYSLQWVEAQIPEIEGISYGFYLFFGICFGGIFGSSMPFV